MKIKKLRKNCVLSTIATVAFLLITPSGVIARETSNPMKKVVKKAFFGRVINCNTIEQITAALADARPGDEIIIAPGTYSSAKKVKDGIANFNYFSCLADGTATNPITLRGASSTNIPILRVAASLEFSGPVLGVTGDYWIIKDLEFSHGSKGIFLDSANNCQLINVSVNTIADEGIHLRTSSKNNLIKNCKIRNVGVVRGGNGEGIYVGSDFKVHGTYPPDCDGNIIEGCIIGPDVRAEGIDVKEGTQNTIIRNNTFSASGISGLNSGDAFVDLKGGFTYVYNNTFNIDGSTILASGIDFQERDKGVNTGFRNAIFNNTFNLGSRASSIPTARKKGGNPRETHIWNNTRNPSSQDFPNSDGTEAVVTKSCPSWNIIPCSGGSANVAPSVSITSPSNSATFTTGASITINASANDSDGTITKVEFFNGSTKLGEDASSPYQYTITSAANGTYNLTARATDNNNATNTSGTVSVTVGSVVILPPPPPPSGTACGFGTPATSSLASFERVTFTKMYVLGTGGPNTDNFKNLKINWNLASNTLNQFAYNTQNGVPQYYVDLRGNIKQTFSSSSNPDIIISNSGYPGLDGDYWVTKKGANFVMVSKTKGFTLYFSNESTAPACSSSRQSFGNDDFGVLKLHLNPSSNQVTVFGVTEDSSLVMSDMQGKTIMIKKISSKENNFDVSTLKSGFYIVNIQSSAYNQNLKLNINK
jgi:parallel beta-helix repeat protein